MIECSPLGLASHGAMLTSISSLVPLRKIFRVDSLPVNILSTVPMPTADTEYVCGCGDWPGSDRMAISETNTSGRKIVRKYRAMILISRG